MKTLESPSFKEEKKEGSSYNTIEVAELEKPMIKLVEMLKLAIDNGEYDTLISDDTSARIPTLVLREVLSVRMRKQNPDLTSEQEREALKTYFVAGGKADENTEAQKEFFNKIEPKTKKALLVTEYIATGQSVRRLADLMDLAGIHCDIASATINTGGDLIKDQEYNLKEIQERHKLFLGSATSVSPPIYSQSGYGGVSKRNDHKSAHPDVAKPSPFGPLEEYMAEAKKEAREDVKLMAKRILEKVWPEK